MPYQEKDFEETILSTRQDYVYKLDPLLKDRRKVSDCLARVDRMSIRYKIHNPNVSYNHVDVIQNYKIMREIPHVV